MCGGHCSGGGETGQVDREQQMSVGHDPRTVPSNPHPKSKSMLVDAREPEGESPVCSAVCGGETRLSAGRSWDSVCSTSGLPCLTALHAPFSELSWKPGAPSLWLDSTLPPRAEQGGGGGEEVDGF